MILVLDGFNVIYKFPDLEEYMVRGKLESAMQGLIQLLTRMRGSYPSYDVHVFFDGRRTPGDDTFRDFINGIHCYYSIDESADHLIKEFVESRMGKAQVRVVSSDKAVRQFAKIHRCELMSSEEFREWFTKISLAKKIDQKEKPEGSLSEREVADWLRLFRGRKK